MRQVLAPPRQNPADELNERYQLAFLFNTTYTLYIVARNAYFRARFKYYSYILSCILKRTKRDYYEQWIIKNGANTRHNWKRIKDS